ncbi:MAG: hypothetical protein ABH856_01260 [Patescibacteria group bacterium]|nr:hypothetical protein [Patescibacteria group bacterium]
MYGEIDVKLRQLLSERLGQNLLSEDDLLEITLKLGQAENEEELRAAAQELTKKHPFLEDAFMAERQIKQRNLQDIVQEFIPTFIKQDPVQAAKLGEMAMNPNISLEELFEFSPEFAKHYNQKYGK